MSAAHRPPFLDDNELIRLLDVLPRAIVVTDTDGTIRLWNRTAEATYGWEASEVIGRSVLDVLIPNFQREQAERIIAQVRDGVGWEGDATVVHRDGTPMRVWATERPLVDDAGIVIGALG